MDPLAFGCLIHHESQLGFAGLLVGSLRRFGGERAQSPVLLFTTLDAEALSERFRSRMSELEALILHVTVETELAALPFGAKSVAAGMAEARAARSVRQLIWCDPDMLFTGDPSGLVLPEDKLLGARPVDIANIGSRSGTEPDDFWKLVHEVCGVQDPDAHPLTSCVDGIPLRGYWNACCLTVRPEEGILRRWGGVLRATLGDPRWQPLLDADPRRRIFLHQAILAGVIRSELAPESILELDPRLNFPLHFWKRHPLWPGLLDDLIVTRIGDAVDHPRHWTGIPMSDGLRNWVEETCRP